MARKSSLFLFQCFKEAQQTASDLYSRFLKEVRTLVDLVLCVNKFKGHLIQFSYSVVARYL